MNTRYCPTCRYETPTYHYSGVWACRECDTVLNTEPKTVASITGEKVTIVPPTGPGGAISVTVTNPMTNEHALSLAAHALEAEGYGDAVLFGMGTAQVQGSEPVTAFVFHLPREPG